MSPPLSFNQIIPVAYIEVHAFSLDDLFPVTYSYLLLQTPISLGGPSPS